MHSMACTAPHMLQSISKLMKGVANEVAAAQGISHSRSALQMHDLHATSTVNAKWLKQCVDRSSKHSGLERTNSPTVGFESVIQSHKNCKCSIASVPRSHGPLVAQ
jgi:hypothetical protein